LLSGFFDKCHFKDITFEEEVIFTGMVLFVVEFRVNVLPTDKDELVNHGDIGLGFRWIGYG